MVSYSDESPPDSRGPFPKCDLSSVRGNLVPAEIPGQQVRRDVLQDGAALDGAVARQGRRRLRDARQRPVAAALAVDLRAEIVVRPVRGHAVADGEVALAVVTAAPVVGRAGLVAVPGARITDRARSQLALEPFDGVRLGSTARIVTDRRTVQMVRVLIDRLLLPDALLLRLLLLLLEEHLPPVERSLLRHRNLRRNRIGALQGGAAPGRGSLLHREQIGVVATVELGHARPAQRSPGLVRLLHHSPADGVILAGTSVALRVVMAMVDLRFLQLVPLGILTAAGAPNRRRSVPVERLQHPVALLLERIPFLLVLVRQTLVVLGGAGNGRRSVALRSSSRVTCRAGHWLARSHLVVALDQRVHAGLHLVPVGFVQGAHRTALLQRETRVDRTPRMITPCKQD
uniref:Uncharacterized protein n=1 Tax=Anopheles atroparvus TaxID=41427 RepID=A0A182JMI1_ANOAO